MTVHVDAEKVADAVHKRRVVLGVNGHVVAGLVAQARVRYVEFDVQTLAVTVFEEVTVDGDGRHEGVLAVEGRPLARIRVEAGNFSFE